MDNGIHFISGLPRSGSTLLSALLRQNPQIHANITSPVGSIFLAALHEMSEQNEGAVFINDERRREVLLGIVKGFYYDIHTEKTVFDTNRLWCSKLPTICTLYPKAKVICCVRDMPWIYDSVERLIRKGLYTGPLILNYVAIGGGAAGLDPADMIEFVKRTPPGSVLTMESAMRAVLPMNAMAIAMGLHVRVGIEDTLWGRKGERMADSGARAATARALDCLDARVVGRRDAELPIAGRPGRVEGDARTVGVELGGHGCGAR